MVVEIIVVVVVVDLLLSLCFVDLCVRRFECFEYFHDSRLLTAEGNSGRPLLRFEGTARNV